MKPTVLEKAMLVMCDLSIGLQHIKNAKEVKKDIVVQSSTFFPKRNHCLQFKYGVGEKYVEKKYS